MRNILLLFITMSFFGCETHQENTTDLANLNLNGKVKSITEVSFEAIDEFGKISKGLKYRDDNSIKNRLDLFPSNTGFYKPENGIILNDFFMQFNEYGNLIEIDNFLDGFPNEKYIFDYNDKNSKTEEREYNRSGKINNSSKYTYNNKNQIIQEDLYVKSTDINRKFTYDYNENDELSGKTMFSTNGQNIDLLTKFTYNKQGLLIESKYSNSNNKYAYKYNYFYDKNNNLIKLTYTDNKGLIQQTYQFKYDANNNVIEEELIHSQDTVTTYGYKTNFSYKYNYKYELDKLNNWVKCILLIDNNPKFIFEREIEYFDQPKIKNKEIVNIENNQEIKTRKVNNLTIPINGWEILVDKNDEDIKLHNLILQNGENIASILSTTNKYITDLREYSDYQNEKFVRNMKPGGLFLTSNNITQGKYKNENSIIEEFDAFHKPTGQNSKMISITFKINEYFYTIFYNQNAETKKLIEDI